MFGFFFFGFLGFTGSRGFIGFIEFSGFSGFTGLRGLGIRVFRVSGFVFARLSKIVQSFYEALGVLVSVHYDWGLRRTMGL